MVTDYIQSLGFEKSMGAINQNRKVRGSGMFELWKKMMSIVSTDMLCF